MANDRNPISGHNRETAGQGVIRSFLAVPLLVIVAFIPMLGLGLAYSGSMMLLFVIGANPLVGLFAGALVVAALLILAGCPILDDFEFAVDIERDDSLFAQPGFRDVRYLGDAVFRVRFRKTIEAGESFAFLNAEFQYFVVTSTEDQLRLQSTPEGDDVKRTGRRTSRFRRRDSLASRYPSIRRPAEPGPMLDWDDERASRSSR